MMYKFFALYLFAKECERCPSFSELPAAIQTAITDLIDTWEVGHATD